MNLHLLPTAPLPLTPGDLTDVLIAFAVGKMSEGFLREFLADHYGLDGDQTRSLWFDAALRGEASAERYRLMRSGPAESTPGAPASSRNPRPG